MASNFRLLPFGQLSFKPVVTPKELDDLAELYQRYTNEGDKHRHSKETLLVFLTNQMKKGVQYVFGLWNGSPVSFIGFSDEVSTVSLKKKRVGQGVFVDKSYRGKGIGTGLLRWLQNNAREASLKYAIKTRTYNKRQQALYEKLGFKPAFIEYSFK